MKSILTNPIVVPLEVEVVQEIIKLIGNIINSASGLTHDQLANLKQHLINKVQTAYSEKVSQSKEEK